MKEQSIISTPFGDAQIIVTQGDHIYMDANGWGDGFTVNRVQMRVSAHFSLVDGKWDHQKRNENHCPYMYTNRFDNGDVSWSALTKLREELPPLITEWAAAHPEVLLQAAINAKKEEIRKKEDALEVSRNLVEQFETELGNMRVDLKELVHASQS
jgi:hypothetical protein